MKTKNQTELPMLELAATSAANEDGISPSSARDASAPARSQAWSPLEVWRTRVKSATTRNRPENAQFQG